MAISAISPVPAVSSISIVSPIVMPISPSCRASPVQTRNASFVVTSMPRTVRYGASSDVSISSVALSPGGSGPSAITTAETAGSRRAMAASSDASPSSASRASSGVAGSPTRNGA